MSYAGGWGCGCSESDGEDYVSPRRLKIKIIYDRDELLSMIRDPDMTTYPGWGGYLREASEELRNDPEVVVEACMEQPDALQYASDDIKENKDIMMKIVSYISLENGGMCQAQSHSERHHSSFDEFKFVSDKLRGDKDILFAAIQSSTYGDACNPDGLLPLKYASKELQADKESVMFACSHNGGSIDYASVTFLEDRDVALVTVAEYGEMLYKLSTNLQTDSLLIALSKIDPGVNLLEIQRENIMKRLAFGKAILHRFGSESAVYKELSDDVIIAIGEHTDYTLDEAARRLIRNTSKGIYNP